MFGYDAPLTVAKSTGKSKSSAKKKKVQAKNPGAKSKTQGNASTKAAAKNKSKATSKPQAKPKAKAKAKAKAKPQTKAKNLPKTKAKVAAKPKAKTKSTSKAKSKPKKIGTKQKQPTAQDVQALKQKIEEANEAYRTGEAIISDTEYDALVERLDELTGGQDELLAKVGFEPADDERKVELPIPMFSMNKIKSGAELQKWGELKKIPGDTVMVITPKYDGLSFCVREQTGDAWTRGNGIVGQYSAHHYATLMKGKSKATGVSGYSFGEIIMRQSVFQKKYAHDFRNSRNMGAGMVNTKEPKDILQDFDYLRFGFMTDDKSDMDKLKQLKLVNELNVKNGTKPVPFKALALEDIDDDLLTEVYLEFKDDYEIDGLIIEVSNAQLRANLGREKNGNPVYARAWKGYQEEAKVTEIKAVDYNVSKHGLLKPIARIEPVELDGVTVSNVTLINAKFVKENSLSPGAQVTVIRSGAVIPKIIDVVAPGPGKAVLPATCPSCDTKTVWNENDVELVCPNHDACPGQRIARIIAFFNILGVENLAEGVLRQFYDNGFDTVAKILAMTQNEMQALEKFAERKAEVIYNGIHEKLKEIPVEKIMHASNVFEGLGTKKLALLRHFNSPQAKPSLDEVVAVEGFSEKTAQIFVDNFDRFWDFVNGLPLTIKKPTEASDHRLKDYKVCFSGVRRKDLEELLTAHGGSTASGVSSKTTHLVMKSKGSGSSKEQKAEQLGVPIFNEAEFEKELKKILG